MKKNKLALFDLDGTLFDTNEVNYRAYQKALAHFGFKFEHDYWYRNCIGIYVYPLPTLQSDVRSYRGSSTCNCSVASERGVCYYCSLPLQDSA